MWRIATASVSLALLSVNAWAALGGGEEYFRYSEFLDQIRNGNIVSVDLDRFSSIKGTYRIDGQERPFRSYGDTGAGNDPLLLDLLKEHDVKINIVGDLEPQEPGFFGFFSLLMFGVPLVTLVYVIRIGRKLNKLIEEQQSARAAWEQLHGEQGNNP